jgi:hypothetical protein
MITPNSVVYTMYGSIIVQLITGLIQVSSLFWNIDSRHKVLKEVLTLETIVQGIELLFYVVVAFVSVKLASLASLRYYDWVLTTPMMLLATIIFMVWSNNEKTKEEPKITFMDTIKKYKKEIASILVLNLMMLGFGYLGETAQMPNLIAVIIGFIPFCMMFGKMYTEFVKYNSSEETKQLYWFMTSVWGLYGVAALMNPILKNVMYNGLDIVAKNFYGLFLFYKLYQLKL